MNLYEVTGYINNQTFITHTIRKPSKGDAVQRYKQAYRRRQFDRIVAVQIGRR